MEKLLHQAMFQLSQRRPIFHSEAEFQFELAIEIKKIKPNIVIWFEYPANKLSYSRIPPQIDLVISDNGELIPIELKYAKGILDYTDANNNTYNLHNKPSDECHEIFKDIRRMYDFKQRYQTKQAYSIVLSNNPSFWKYPSPKVILARDMYLIDGNMKMPQLYEYVKGSHIPLHTQQNVEILQKFEVVWNDFSSLKPIPSVHNSKNNIFRYLIVEI